MDRTLTSLPIRAPGLTVGPLQRSGPMTVAPLFGAPAPGRFLPPLSGLKLSRVAGYGNVELECRPTSRPQGERPDQTSKKGGGVAIVPLHIGYIQDQAQNHALCGSGLMCAGQKRMFDDACCVQQAQGGYLEGRDQWFFILPLSLRHTALELRGRKGYNKLWPAIGELSKRLGFEQRGHLEPIVCGQRYYLTQYASRFELLPGQVGALFFIDDKLVGFELAPDEAFFAELWMPLVCFCYGVGAMPREAKRPAPAAPFSARSLAGLRDELAASRRRTEAKIWDGLAALGPEPHERHEEERLLDLELVTVIGQRFSGQLVEQDGRTVYASLAARPTWASAA